MEKKLLVIMEVKRDSRGKSVEGMDLYFPIDVHDNDIDEQECLWLKPERIIDGERVTISGLTPPGTIGYRVSPPPEEKSEFEKWEVKHKTILVDAIGSSEQAQVILDAIKDMPREKK